ncbi:MULTISPECIES: hypothetical protein [unclassified Erwinia]|uniref:hypothetical protein n=1 Tax=unclassified Erwinia TaxID=2622719 RepID=UPI000C3C2FBB|nr:MULTISPECIES: hypothetical protein [unclassified Erwinia]PIJ85790.1 hypothetical protein BLD49_09830 [Erwinia sp. OLMDSP33]
MMNKIVVLALTATGLAGWPARMIKASELASAPTQRLITEQAALPLNRADFTVIINQHKVALMAFWDSALAEKLGPASHSDYVGSSPEEGGGYKFYRYQYDSFTLYTSNLDWEKQRQEIDSYRIAQITLHSPVLRTARGIHIGSTEQAVLQAYGTGVYESYQDIQRRCYRFQGMELVFTLQHNDVNAITLVWSGRH